MATPLAEQLCQLIEKREPRVELIRDQSLYPPMRHPADFTGDPAFSRTPEQQRAFEEMLDSADALYGIPDVDPAALKRTADANPDLRWVHTMAAGGGGQVKAAGLDPAQLRADRRSRTSAGVHGGPLAEFAVFGVLAGAKDLPRLLAQQRDHIWTGRWQMRQVSRDDRAGRRPGRDRRRGGRAGCPALGATVVGTSRHQPARSTTSTG